MINNTFQYIPRTYGFAPLLCQEPRILILGSLPGIESLERNQYYYTNSNRIWKVISRITGDPIPSGYDQKKKLLSRNHIVLWDYYESAIRNGSKDKDIRDGRPNDILSFIRQYPSIKVIAINGFGKYKRFGERIVRKLASCSNISDIRVLRLPDTSGLNKNYGWSNLEALSAEWAHIFD